MDGGQKDKGFKGVICIEKVADGRSESLEEGMHRAKLELIWTIGESCRGKLNFL